MINRRQEEQKSPAKRFLFILGLFMFVFYLVLGVLVLFWKELPFELSSTYRIVFGSFLICYAVLRLVRLLQTRNVD